MEYYNLKGDAARSKNGAIVRIEQLMSNFSVDEKVYYIKYSTWTRERNLNTAKMRLNFSILVYTTIRQVNYSVITASP